ncbi:hypothetical protein AB0C77_13690 [Streptomyces sp. NPDC048629]
MERHPTGLVLDSTWPQGPGNAYLGLPFAPERAETAIRARWDSP